MDFGLDDFEQNGPQGRERKAVPPGDHTMRINRMSTLEDGRVEIWLEHPDQSYGFVFARPPKDGWGARLLSTMRKACGMSREEWQAADMHDLVGRQVVVRIYHREAGGRLWINVGEFLGMPSDADPPTAPKAKPVATPTRTPTQKADAASAMPADDIPF